MRLIEFIDRLVVTFCIILPGGIAPARVRRAPLSNGRGLASLGELLKVAIALIAEGDSRGREADTEKRKLLLRLGYWG
jgi:hypothetical protein